MDDVDLTEDSGSRQQTGDEDYYLEDEDEIDSNYFQNNTIGSARK